MKLKLVLAAAAAALMVAVPVAVGGSPKDPVPVWSIDPNLVAVSAVSGASSTLIRHDNSIQMTLHTSGLPAGHVVTVWWIIFNNPAACSNGEPANPAIGFPGTKCGPGDLDLSPSGGPAQSSIVHATGHVIGGDGVGNYAAYLTAGSTKEEVLGGPGLTNPLGAHVHLLVHDHAALADLGNVGKEINSIGQFQGVDLQVAIHE